MDGEGVGGLLDDQAGHAPEPEADPSSKAVRMTGLSGNLHIMKDGLVGEAHGLREVIRETSAAVRSGPVQLRRASEVQDGMTGSGALYVGDRVRVKGSRGALLSGRVTACGPVGVAVLHDDGARRTWDYSKLERTA